MKSRKTGRYDKAVAGSEEVKAFIPYPLPPKGPPISLEGILGELNLAAAQALSKLELAGEMIPSLDWFLYGFVRKEAVLTSQIEGTQATLDDLPNYEATEDQKDPSPDIEEVSNYIQALSYARNQMADPAGLPISMRLLNESHKILMKGVRGQNKQPGEIRRSQNWIGGTRPGNASYVPPPPNKLSELLSDFETFIHKDARLPPLIHIGLLHAQFESIHPYLDGNGRIGRLLIALLLEYWGLMAKPILYLSLYLKRHQSEYYRRLNKVRHGDWEGWLSFFLEAVQTIANEAAETARNLFALVSVDRSIVLETETTTVQAIRLFEYLPRQPTVTVTHVMNKLGMSKPTAIRAIDALIASKVLAEVTGRKRDRIWVYKRYLDLLKGSD